MLSTLLIILLLLTNFWYYRDCMSSQEVVDFVHKQLKTVSGAHCCVWYFYASNLFAHLPNNYRRISYPVCVRSCSTAVWHLHLVAKDVITWPLSWFSSRNQLQLSLLLAPSSLLPPQKRCGPSKLSLDWSYYTISVWNLSVVKYQVPLSEFEPLPLWTASSMAQTTPRSRR